MHLINFKETIDLSGYTLVIPSVAVGNVPQLATDLLITTLKLKNVATFWHPGLVASVGPDPFYSENKTICTACELYANPENKIAAIQIRSTIETKLMLKFFAELKSFLIALKLNKVFILSTGFDYELHNISEKDTFYFISSDRDSDNIIKTIAAKPLKVSSNGKLLVRGSGYAIKLYEMLNDNINCTLIVKYVSEGENIFDAKIYLMKLFEFIDVKRDLERLSLPSSWQYGAPPPMGLF